MKWKWFMIYFCLCMWTVAIKTHHCLCMLFLHSSDFFCPHFAMIARIYFTAHWIPLWTQMFPSFHFKPNVIVFASAIQRDSFLSILSVCFFCSNFFLLRLPFHLKSMMSFIKKRLRIFRQLNKLVSDNFPSFKSNYVRPKLSHFRFGTVNNKMWSFW